MGTKPTDLSDRIRLVRERMGKSQKDFAAALDASFRAYQDYEAGKIVPGGRVLAALARLGIDTNWLLNGDGDVAPAADTIKPVVHVDCRSGRPRDALMGLAAGLHSPTLASLEVRGDAMAPEMVPGDLVVFDRAAVAVDSGMYVLKLGEQLVTRRLQVLLGGAVEVQPANLLYKAEVLTAAAAADMVAGRIVAVLRRV